MGTQLTYAATGGPQQFTVPAGVTSLTVGLTGGNGGGPQGGVGGTLAGNLAVTPGQVLYFYVGAAGGNPSGSTGGPGGYNGGGKGGDSTNTGGAPGYGGGGGTDIRTGSALSTRLCAVGGGGGRGRGGGTTHAGGAGGGTTGAAGADGSVAGDGGKGGTQSAGGAAGADGGNAGASGVGGAAGSATATNGAGGGGGGGGFYGGGGGGNGHNVNGNDSGDGGGGSSYVGSLTNAASAQGGSTGSDGSLSVYYNAPPNAPTLNSPQSGNYLDPSLAQTFTWTFSDPDSGDTQANATLQYRVVGASSWTQVAISGSTQTYTAAAGTFTAGNNYEWQVQTSDGTVTGPFSASNQFTAANPPAAPTVTAPLSSVTANPTTITWTTPVAQVAYQVRLVGDSNGTAVSTTVYNDTGAVSSSAKSISLGLGTAQQGGSLHVQVRYQQNPGLWSPWGDSGVESVNVGLPGVPTLSFAVAPYAGQITVVLTNPSTPAPTTYQDLFRTDVADIPLNIDWTTKTAVPSSADSLQPLLLVGQPTKLQSNTLAMQYAGSGAQYCDLGFVMTNRIGRLRAEFLFESAAWTTDGASLTLSAYVAPFTVAGGTPDGHIQVTLTRTTWAMSFISGGTVTSILSGSYTTLPLDSLLSVEVSVNQYTGTITLWLPDGSIKTSTPTGNRGISGVVADVRMAVNAANTDRRVRLLNFWGSDTDFGEIRIVAGLPPNTSYVDSTPASGKVYRYRSQAHAFYGGTVSSA